MGRALPAYERPPAFFWKKESGAKKTGIPMAFGHWKERTSSVWPWLPPLPRFARQGHQFSLFNFLF